jgi:membrane-bound serine protease (ClpP class)
VSWPWILIAWLAGVGLLLVELFVPGIILGSIGTLLIAGAVVAMFAYYGGAAGSGLMAGSLALVALVIKVGVSRLSHEHRLDEEAGYVGTDDLSDMLGEVGVAATMLRPGGFATIAGKRVDVVTRGEHLEKGTPVVVCNVEGNVVEVRQSEKE